MSQVAKQCNICRRKRISGKCKVCGRLVTERPSHIRNACGRACADVLRAKASSHTQSRKIYIFCKRCGKKRLVSPAYATRKYCSNYCYTQSNKGKNNHAWKGGITAKHDKFYSSVLWKIACRDIWARERRKCQRCKKESKRSHHVHHIKSWSRYPKSGLDRSNLALLCLECHRFVHSKRNKNKEFIFVLH